MSGNEINPDEDFPLCKNMKLDSHSPVTICWKFQKYYFLYYIYDFYLFAFQLLKSKCHLWTLYPPPWKLCSLGAPGIFSEYLGIFIILGISRNKHHLTPLLLAEQGDVCCVYIRKYLLVCKVSFEWVIFQKCHTFSKTFK